MMPIRIMHVTNSLGTGGTEMVVRRLVAGLDQSRFEHILCTVSGAAEREIAVNAKHLSLRQEKGPKFLIGALRQVISDENPDVVHSRNWGAIEAVIAARSCGKRSIHSEHGLDIDGVAHQPMRRRLARNVIYRMADHLFAVTSHLREYYIREVGSAAKKMIVIPNGVDTDRFRPDVIARGRMRAALGIADNKVLLGAVSRLDPIKDHMTLLRSVVLCVADGMPIELAIVGDGVMRGKIEEFISQHAILNGKVHMVGEATNVPDWLNAFDMFVLPSICEGMSNTLLEAMACGVPVLATNVGGNLEVLEDGRSGYLFDVGDAESLSALISRLAQSREGRANMSVNARSRVESTFSIRSMIQRYSDMYSAWSRTGATTQDVAMHG